MTRTPGPGFRPPLRAPAPAAIVTLCCTLVGLGGCAKNGDQDQGAPAPNPTAQEEAKSPPVSKETSMSSSHTSASQTPSPIEGLGYLELFAQGKGKQIVAQPGVPEQLEELATDPDRPPYRRLLAAELLRQHRNAYPMPPDEMAELHAAAMVDARFHNGWGMPGEPVEFGRGLLGLGDPVEAAMKSLLDEKRELRYFGSEEPTLAGMYRYRVCDLAAGILAYRKKMKFIDDRSPDVRDEWIADNL